jgi:phosphatidylserine decarboxylase
MIYYILVQKQIINYDIELKIYKNHQIKCITLNNDIYLKLKSNHVNFNENIYLEINNIFHVINIFDNLIKLNPNNPIIKLSIIKVMPKCKKINPIIYDFTSNISISNMLISNIPIPITKTPISNNLSVIKHVSNYIYFPKFQSLLPELVSNKSIFYKINKYLNFKYFRIKLTKLKILNLFFKSKYLGSKLIKKFNIDVDKFQITKPYTLANVFTRRLKSIYENIPITNTNIYSPASSRVRFLLLDKNLDQSYPNIIIKGSKFNHKKIINDELFIPQNIIIFRLGPQDYHHFYMPTSGILLDYYWMGDDYQSVNYDFIYSNKFNPLNDNFRLILKFKHIESKKIFYLIIIGATIVGSICTDELIIGKLYKTFEYLGWFDLGGSCMIFLSEKKILMRPDIIYYSKYHIETYLSVFDQINLSNTNEKFIFTKLNSDDIILHFAKLYSNKISNTNKDLIKIVIKLLLIFYIIYLIKSFRSKSY